MKGRPVRINKRGTVEELREKALSARKSGTRRHVYEYIGWFYQLFTVDRTWILESLDNDRLDTQVTSLESFLRTNDAI